MNSNPIVVEKTYRASIAAVWNAITDQEQMRQWFFNTMSDFEPKVGFETQFDVEAEGRIFPHQWKVTEVVPETRISYEWRYEGFSGDSTVTWELFETPGGTKLILTHRGQETFAQDDPMFSREAGEAGWHYFLHESLNAYLEQSGS